MDKLPEAIEPRVIKIGAESAGRESGVGGGGLQGVRVELAGTILLRENLFEGRGADF